VIVSYSCQRCWRIWRGVRQRNSVIRSLSVMAGTAVGDHGDKNDLEFTEGFMVFACDAVLAYVFGDLKISDAVWVWRGWSWVE
jgi:hypothetical protein